MRIRPELRSVEHGSRGYRFLKTHVVEIEPHEMTGEEAQQYLSLVADDAACVPSPMAAPEAAETNDWFQGRFSVTVEVPGE